MDFRYVLLSFFMVFDCFLMVFSAQMGSDRPLLKGFGQEDWAAVQASAREDREEDLDSESGEKREGAETFSPLVTTSETASSEPV